PKGSYGMNAFMKSVDTKVLGRKTYEVRLRMGAKFDSQSRTIVFSRHPPPADAPSGVESVKYSIGPFVSSLRAQYGRDRWSVCAGYLFPLALLLVPEFCAVAQARPAASRVRTIVDSLAHAYLDAGHSPGLSIEVVRGRDTLVRAGYGLADLEQQVAASPSTLYEIGSITKQFTAAAVMRLVEAGRIRLDDSIGAYVGDLPLAWRRVSVRQLLNHTSGIPSMTDIGQRWVRRWRQDMPTDSLVALTARDSMWFAPGTNWRYDNTGYL